MNRRIFAVLFIVLFLITLMLRYFGMTVIRHNIDQSSLL